mmetsp:Transcript_29128/g.74865  ORF Transcript_29128/g.74865 Transcript_29128/m.74865 type:complete len:80 (-) Transcript_29128:114-353(-)
MHVRCCVAGGLVFVGFVGGEDRKDERRWGREVEGGNDVRGNRKRIIACILLVKLAFSAFRGVCICAVHACMHGCLTSPN